MQRDRLELLDRARRRAGQRQIIGRDPLARPQYDCALKDIAQLAGIARPAMGLQLGNGRRGRPGKAEARLISHQKIGGDGDHIAWAIGKRLQHQRHHVQVASTWRTAHATFYLSPKPAGAGIQVFRFSGIGAAKSQIRFAFIDAPSARITLACDGPYIFRMPGNGDRKSDGSEAGFDLVADMNGQTGAVLEPNPATTACTMRVDFAFATRYYRLEREEIHAPLIAALDTAHENCADVSARSQVPLEKAFLSSGDLSQTCAFAAGKPELLPDPENAFNARIKALLGRTLSAQFIGQGNPYAPIDFSAAPRLKLIVISALDFKADFSGALMARLISHHAARGTPVRIMASTILERHKDVRLLKHLAAEYANVSVEFFAFKPSTLLDPSQQLAALHRVHHVKLFAALGEDPKDSVAILGGRNIHDGFLYETPLNLRAFPQLHTYPGRGAMTLNYYTNWHDFDLAFHDENAVWQLIAHFNWLWTSDLEAHTFRPLAKQKPGKSPASPTRHFLSVPYSDGHALEGKYAELIDAAQVSIEIVNPYLNLTPPLKAAFDRAIARGVHVEIIGRIDMTGDLGGEILTAVNQKFVAENYQRIAIRDYRLPEVVLHSKIMLIDGKLSIISSVNLNNRSFLHDTENGVMIYDTGFYRKMKALFELYRSQSDPVTDPKQWTPYRLLLLSPTIRQTF